MFLNLSNKKIKDFLSNQNRYLPFIIAGILLFLSFPAFDLYFLAWFALAPVLLKLYDEDFSFAFKAGLLLGVIYFFGNIYWIYHAIYVYGSMSYVLSVLAVFLLSLYMSLYTAAFCFLYSVAIKKTSLPSLFIAPCLWTSLEFIRSYAFTGFPWSSLGYSQYEFLPLIQLADITGIYGISFLIVAFNGAIADIFIIRKIKVTKPLFSSFSFIGGIFLLGLLFLLIFTYGGYRLYQDRDASTIKAAIIQGNIEQDKKWDILYQNSVLHAYMDLTSKAAELSPDIIIWPETALPFSFQDDKVLTEKLIAYQQNLQSYLLFGSILVKEDLTSDSKKIHRLSNSAVLLDKKGNISYIYDKIHLVPFGEYVPLKNILFFIDKLVYGFGDYHPGDSYIKAVTPFGSFATLICYEIIFPGMVRKFFINDGDFIINITNDAWFGNTHGPYQHFSMAVFRAIENRKPVLRVANSGISGFIDSKGNIVAKTNLFEQTYIVGEIKKDSTRTLYTKYGDIFSYLCIIISVTLFISFYKKY